MSKYDKEREALGLKPIGSSVFSIPVVNQSSKYAAEREAIRQLSNNEADRKGFEQRILNSSPSLETMVNKPFTNLGINPPEIAPSKETKRENWYSTIKSGNILGGLGKLALETLGGVQTAALNLSKNAVNLVQGKPLEWKSDYSYAEYLQDVAPNAPQIKAIQSNTFGGNVLRGALEVATDPLTYVGGGIADDLMRARSLRAGLPTYDIRYASDVAQRAAKKVPLTKIEQKLREPINELPSAERLLLPERAMSKIEVGPIPDRTVQGIIPPRGRAINIPAEPMPIRREQMWLSPTGEIEIKRTPVTRGIPKVYADGTIVTERVPAYKFIKNADTSKITYDDILAASKPVEIKKIEPELPQPKLEVPEQYRTEIPRRVLPGELPNKLPTLDEVATSSILDDLRPKVEQPKVKPVEPQRPVFGETPKGEIPEGMRERGFSRNTRTDINNPDELRRSFDEKPLSYEQIHGKDTVSKAQAILDKGDEAATRELYSSLNSNEFRPEMVPLSKMLARKATEAGNIEKAREIISSTAEQLTRAGQFSQAARLLRESDPETFLMTIDKQLKKLNEQGLKQYSKKWKNIDLTSEELEAIRKIPRGDEVAYETVWEQIGNRIAKELPSTAMEKFDAWRRIAMLLNPKTHIRNTLGNVIMAGMRKASDTIGAAFEKAFVPVGQRTKSIGWSLNKDIARKVDEAWESVKKDLLGESRWEIDNLKALNREKRIFKNDALQALNDISLKSLNFEDNIFTKRAYKDALGQFIQANKLDTVTEEAKEYAKRRALEATFKQANLLSNWINQAKQVKGIGKLVEGAIPFSKTPANIAARAVEYSPIGLLKALYGAKTGKTAASVIEDLSKGLTGSAIAALGLWLASMGWLKVERNRSEKAEGLLTESGEQPYSITTPIGSYTFDWAQPFVVPLAMGIAVYESLSKRKNGDGTIEAIIDGVAAGGDTIFNMTMLKNIKSILGSGGSVSQKIMGIPVAYLEQAIPTIFGQVARIVDDTRRSTYDPNPAVEEWNKIKSRIPFASKTLEPKLDIWGNEQKQAGAAQQFLSPGYALPKNNDKTTQELVRLYKSLKETDLLPRVAPERFTNKGKDIILTPKQVTEFQREMGQKNYRDISAKINTSEYKNADDTVKAKYIKTIVERNYEQVKKKYIPK